MTGDDCAKYIFDAMSKIKHARFYESERGYQGELIARLNASASQFYATDNFIIEQEYQKKLDVHGIKIRPDILIHRPRDLEEGTGVRDNNLIVMELKLRASYEQAKEDFEKICMIGGLLNYRFGVFINIDADTTYLENISAKPPMPILGFGSVVRHGKVIITQCTVK